MHQYNRKEFLKMASLASMCLLLPPRLSGKRKDTIALMAGETELAASASFIVDLHTHPSMKYMLLNKKIWKRHLFAYAGENDISIQMDVHRIRQGNMKGIVAAHYLPERGILEQGTKLKSKFRWLKHIVSRAANSFEMGDGGNFRQICSIMDDFEEQVRISREKSKQEIFIARSYEEFQVISGANDKIAIAHAIEGAHAIGRNLKNESEYIENVEFLAGRGVCMITLSHFFSNDLSYPVEGIEPTAKHKKMGIFWEYNPLYDDRPLTDIGVKVVKKMLEIGIVVDITHLTPKARTEVFKINEEGHFNRPVIFSHAGVHELFKGPARYKNYGYYNVLDSEIDDIKKCNGVIGIVFENYWLTGIELTLRKESAEARATPRKALKRGIDNVIRTMKYIIDRTGSYDYVALGADFDGLANAPADLKNPSSYNSLVCELRAQLKLTDEQLGKITHGNAMRVLKHGWGPKK